MIHGIPHLNAGASALPTLAAQPQTLNDSPAGMVSEENSERLLVPPAVSGGPSRMGSPFETPAGGLNAECGVRNAEWQTRTSECQTRSAEYFSARHIAHALQCSKKTVARRAQEQAWPQRQVGNKIEFAPPADIQAQCGRNVSKEESTPPAVRFSDLTHSGEARARALLREAAVLRYHELIKCGLPVEFCLSTVVVEFHQRISCTAPTLRRWIRAYDTHALDGVVEQMIGRCGAKPISAELPDELRQRGKAMTIEHGSVARAARELSADPRLPASLRSSLHEGHTSKSYVTPSIRKAITPAPLTVARVQGPKHARLLSRWTPGDYSNLRSGDVFVSDDMTANCVVWCESPDQRGWRLGQPQILPVMDVRSLRWLAVRVIMRESGQYTADDIWGLFGDVFDTFGLPARGFLLEGGHWQSNAVRGHATGLSAEDRIGGLSSLGLKIWRSYDPRSKGMLEGGFNIFQYAADAFPGFVGRAQRTDLPEAVKKQIALCNSGKAHPRQFFQHVKEYADHIQAVFERLNHERQDGQILRGNSPLEQWAEHDPQLRQIPPAARWLYRSAMSVCRVTRNGVRVTQGSGRNQMVYYYDAPELLVPRQGSQVVCYWNDKNPDADAALLDAATRKFIGCAKRVKPLHRFDASAAELDAEADRKRAASAFARTELRAIQPELQRSRVPIPAGESTVAIGGRIAAAADQAEDRQRTRRETDRAIASAPLTTDDVRAAIGSETEPEADRISADEIADLFADEK